MFRFNKNEIQQSTQRKYPTVVQQIHNEFNTAGDRLLEEAKKIIANTQIQNEEKSQILKNFGFTSTPEAVEYDKVSNEKQQSEILANTLQELTVSYPRYKFITKKVAIKICEKYNLVLGDVSQFKGFVPDKNLRQIEEFYRESNELNTQYTMSYYMGMMTKEISKKEFDALSKRNRKDYDSGYYLMEDKRPLKIAAPLKDMNAKGYKLKGNIFERETPPDPVVLAPINRAGIELFCIVTAWGDEASDPMVVNQINN